MSIALEAANLATAVERPIRVMVVDDAIVVRRLLTRWIGAEPDMMVAACLRTGREAVDQLERCNPDVVVLDVDMPELDGISALPLLLKKKRDLVVIMASTLTRRSAEISLRALSLGAADYVPKPEVAPDAETSVGVPSRADRENPYSRPARPFIAAPMAAACGCGSTGAAPTRRRAAASRSACLRFAAVRARLAAGAADRLFDRRSASAQHLDR